MAPGAPPPVQLVESLATSITVSWEMPRSNGGKKVTGYELWIDEWNGGDSYMVFDGSDAPDILAFKVSTYDIGPLSPINHLIMVALLSLGIFFILKVQLIVFLMFH